MMRATTAPAERTVAWMLLVCFLLAARVPSLVEPAGADQSLYAYVGQRINAGDVPYRDAWDQKPPAVHFLYASLWWIWPHDSVIAAADMVAAGLTAWLLVMLGRRTFGVGVGLTAACVFLVLGNPAIQRLSGVRVRGQCETFIALAVTAALVAVMRADRGPRHLVLAGVLLGVAFWFKYNAGIYLLPVLVALSTVTARPTPSPGRGVAALLCLALGFAAVGACFVAYFAAHGALTDLWLATISYNLQYSQETYSGPWHALQYLTFPIERASKDALWYFGGIGCVVLVVAFRRRPYGWVTVAWVASACVSILVNGTRDLPQYFVQAHPALAFAGAIGLWPIVRRDLSPLFRVAVLVALGAGLWRVGDESLPLRLAGQPGVIDNMRFDLDYARGRIDRATYLARFQQQRDLKYVPLAAERLAQRVRETTAPTDTIFVFGYSSSVYVHTGRPSASRFFWSRPVEVEFGTPRPGYGSRGLLADLERRRPALVALQKHWGPGAQDPIEFFLSTPPLRAWLDISYVLEDDTAEFAVFRRRS